MHTPMPQNLRISQGFSLIELMVVVALLGILAAIAAPSLRDMMVQNRLSNSSNELIATLQFARAEAIKRNQTIRFTFNSQTQTWQVLDSTSKLLRTGQLPNTIQLSSTLNNSTLSFGPTGLNDVSDSKNSLTLNSTSGSEAWRKIIIGLSGRTIICEPNKECPQ